MSAIRNEQEEIKRIKNIKENYYRKNNRLNKLYNALKMLKNALLIISVFILGIGTIYNYGLITQGKAEISKLEEEIKLKTSQYEHTRVQIDSIKNSANIEDVAKAYFGLDYPKRKQIVYIDGPIIVDTIETETQNIEDTKNIDIYKHIKKLQEIASKVKSKTIQFLNEKIG